MSYNIRVMINGINSSAVVEITSSSIKLMVGFVFEDKVYPYYALEKPLPSGVIHNGLIVNRSALIEELKAFSIIQDSNARLKLTITDAYLGIPPIGLQVYDSDRSCETMSDDDRVSTMDIKNLRVMLSKQNVEGSIVVDVVPTTYTLDGGRQYLIAPIGEVSKNIKIDAKLYSIPKDIYDSYVSCFRESGITLRRPIITSVGTVCYLNTINELPKNYFFLDIGSELSTISLVGNKQLFASETFYYGGESVTKDIMENFHCTYEVADKIKRIYGFDNRPLTFKPIVYKTENENGKNEKYDLETYNAILKANIDHFLDEFDKSLDTLATNPKIKSLPIYVFGGAAALFGFIDYFKKSRPSYNIIPLVPTTIGARKPGFFNCLGLLKNAQTNQIGQSNNMTKATSLSREEN